MTDGERPSDPGSGQPAPEEGDPARPAPEPAITAARPPAGSEPRPWIERLGLAAIAAVMAALLTFMAIAAWVGGEGILAAMSASGAILTAGVGLLTLVRG